MEIQINKDIRDYTESIFLGLDIRQSVSTVIGCAISGIVFFLIRGKFGLDLSLFISLLFSLPALAYGFIKINGMTIDKYVKAMFFTLVQTPAELPVKSNSIYYSLIKADKEQQEILDKIDQRNKRKGRGKYRDERNKAKQRSDS